MEKDLKLLREILKDYHFAPLYINELMKKIIDRVEDSKFDELTPNIIYYSLVYDLQKTAARKVADKFEELKNPTN